jgi:serine/threonine protein phosphatase PrpC
MKQKKFDKINISTPVFLNEQGQHRPYSEDYLFPFSEEDFAIFQKGLESSNQIFIVCDGVGGSAKGDMASKTVCKHFSRIAYEKSAYRATEEDVFYSLGKQKEVLQQALRLTEQEMDKLVADNPEWKGMSTTLTYLNLSPYGAIVGWAGDSRVYHVRNIGGQSKIINVTDDHSFVNELYKRGDITAEERDNHPRKNLILRAVSSSQKPTEIDVQIWDDLRTGDYLFLCTDGITEGFGSEKELVDLLGDEKLSLKEKKEIIHKTCHANSRDNYTMYLLRIDDAGNAGQIVPLLEEDITEIRTSSKQNRQEILPSSSKFNWKYPAMIGGVFLLGFLVWFFVLKDNGDVEQDKRARETRNETKKTEDAQVLPQRKKEQTPKEDNNIEPKGRVTNDSLKQQPDYSEIKNIGQGYIKAKANGNWTLLERDTTANDTTIIVPKSLGLSSIDSITIFQNKKILRAKKNGYFGYIIINKKGYSLLKEKGNVDFNIYQEAPKEFGTSFCNKYTEVRKKEANKNGAIILKNNSTLGYTSIENAKKNCSD